MLSRPPPCVAFRAYELAAELGDVPSQRHMGDMRYFGQGAPKNLSAALALYAANAGDAQVVCLLYLLY